MPCPPLGPLLQYVLDEGADVQITSSGVKQSRSESVVVVNPINAQNLICASKKFVEPAKYFFTISTSFSIDGGQSWTESQPKLEPGWDGMSDPDLTFDHLGNAYLIVEPIKFNANLDTFGMFVYKSADGGKTWLKPVQLHLDLTDDKQWIDADTSPASPYFGNVYAVWGAHTPLRFARSADHGATWQGMGALPSGSDVVPGDCFAPSLTVGEDGTIHVAWHSPGGSDIAYTRSTDGGNSFAPVTSVVTGISSLSNALPSISGFAHFPNGSFRVMTIVTGCAAKGNRLVLAWADFREGVSRIYYRTASNSGTTWEGPASGQALLPAFGQSDQQHFHPQLAQNGKEAIGCAFYEFGPKPDPAKPLIDVRVSFSCSDGASFSDPIVVTDQPWDPAVNAPLSHGVPGITFIGEYFGFAGSHDSFATVWTDTRTGVQELFFDGVLLRARRSLPNVPVSVVEILAGVVQDGGGLVFVGGKIIKIPPWDPWIDVLHALAAIDAVKNIGHESADRALSALHDVVASVAQHALQAGRKARR